MNLEAIMTAAAGVMAGEVTDLGGGNLAVIFDRSEGENYLLGLDDDDETWIVCYERADDDGQREWVNVAMSDGVPSAEAVRAVKDAARAMELI